jgi:hypothetical protein
VDEELMLIGTHVRLPFSLLQVGAYFATGRGRHRKFWQKLDNATARRVWGDAGHLQTFKGQEVYGATST